MKNQKMLNPLDLLTVSTLYKQILRQVYELFLLDGAFDVFNIRYNPSFLAISFGMAFLCTIMAIVLILV